MKRVLVIGPSWVGDMVMAQSLFKLLLADEAVEISVLAPAWSEPVLARMPEVTQSIVMPVGHGSLGLNSRWSLARQLKNRFDQAIVLPGSLKSALVPWLARIPRRTGFIGEQRYGLLNDIRKLDKNLLPLHVQRLAALTREKTEPPFALDAIPKPQLVVKPENRIQACARVDIVPDKKTLVLCPGAEFGPAKQWPVSYYAEVASWAVKAGYQVIVMGSAKDTEAAKQIKSRTDQVHDLTGKTSLGDAIDLMSLADHVITNDSGLMHIAAALSRKVIAIYGSSSDDYTPPLSDTAIRLSKTLDCRPCFQRTCPLGHLDCLKKITPDQVITKIQS